MCGVSGVSLGFALGALFFEIGFFPGGGGERVSGERQPPGSLKNEKWPPDDLNRKKAFDCDSRPNLDLAGV